MSCDVPWQQPDVSAEEDIIRLAADLPTISGELRLQVLAAAAKAYGNNRFLQRLQIVAFVFVCLSFAGLLSTYYVALYRVGFGVNSIVLHESRSPVHNTLPADQTETEKVDQNVLHPQSRPLVGEISFGPIVSAAASSDEWALVDAFGALQISKSDAIRKLLWH